MHPRKFILHLTAICICSVLPLFGVEPQGQFWILRTSNETAVPLVEALEGKKLPPTDLASKIIALIDTKKIQQLARFDQMLGEGVIRRQNQTGEMRSPDNDEVIKTGVTLEAEVILMEDTRKAHLRLMTEINEKKSKDDYYLKTMSFQMTLYDDQWELAGFWKSAKETTLCLVRITDYPATTDAKPACPATVLQMEVLEARPEDIIQFRKSTPTTREKAVAWLRERSKRLAGAVIKNQAGQLSSLQDGVSNFAGERGGLSAMLEQITSGNGKEVDIALNAQWQDPAELAQKENYEFSVGETLDVGQTQLFEPSVAPKSKGPLPVILMTAQVTLPNTPLKEPEALKDLVSRPDVIIARSYPVAPRFMRVIMDSRELNNRPRLREALARRGLEFPLGTSATMKADSCEVLLAHDQEGHSKFMALLKELDLLP